MPTLTNGPFIRHITSTGLSIWLRLDGPGQATLRVDKDVVLVTVDANFMGVGTFTELEAASPYSYVVEIGGSLVSGPHFFRTMPIEGRPGQFDLILYQDPHELNSDDEYQQMESVLAERKEIPRLAVNDGDLWTFLSTSWTLASRRQELQDFLGTTGGTEGGFRKFFAKTCLYHSWDDWDFAGNQSAGEMLAPGQREIIAQVEREFFAGSPPYEDPAGLAIYRSFLVADCLIIQMDGRMYKDGTPGMIGFPPPFDHLLRNQVWGVTQLQWLKDTLLAHQAAPLKLMFVQTSTSDQNRAGPSGPARRDSIGLYHRRERNELLQFLVDNPKCAEGLIFLSGDDHVSAVRVATAWREPEPYASAACQPAGVWPSQPYLVIPDLKSGQMGLEGQPELTENWYGSPYERFACEGESMFTLIQVETQKDPPHASFRVFATPDGGETTERYRFELNGPTWYFPASQFHTVAPTGFVRPVDPLYSLDSGPGSIYTPDSGAGSAYSDGTTSDLLVGDGKFETGTFVGWDITTRCFVVTDPVYAGLWSCNMESRRSFGTGTNATLSRPITFPSSSLRLKLRIRYEDISPPGGAPVRIFLDKGDGLFTEYGTFLPIADSGWRTFQYDFVPLGTAGRLQFQLTAPAIDGFLDAYLDDIQVLQGAFNVWS